LSNGDWELTKDDWRNQVITAMYFALTTLSGVGFGDLYPKTNAERLFISIFLLGVITVFAFVVDELG